MQLIAKTIKGQKYWYLVEKGRKNGVVTNVKTIYIGKADRLAQMLADPGTTEAAFPTAFRSREAGASAALWAEAHALDIVAIIDRVLGPRRSDAAVSYGALFVAAAIQRAIAPPARKSSEQLRAWYEGCGLSDFMPVDPAGLDARRVHEALSCLRAPDLERLEERITAAVLAVHHPSLSTLAFDTTNFDSYAGPGNSSRLLRRGHAKSKRTDLRVLGLGLLATADDGLPLLSFVYPGNRADVRSFGSFLRRLQVRQRALGVDTQTTVVCDGGNLSRAIVERMERERVHYIARLPTGHAPAADALATDALAPLSGRLSADCRAHMLDTAVYEQSRTVVAVYSKPMHEAQLPGLLRDRKKAEESLRALQQRLSRQRRGQGVRKHWLTREGVRKRGAEALSRQHMAELYPVEVGGTDEAPTLQFHFDEAAWQRLERHRLGRTVIVTDRKQWSVEAIVEALREQIHVEDAFRQLKDPQWSAAVPLRHRTDPMLRVHAFIAVLSLLLCRLLVRRLRLAGVEATVSEALYELTELRLARVHYGRAASPLLRKMAAQREVPPAATARQRELVHALGLDEIARLGPT